MTEGPDGHLPRNTRPGHSQETGAVPVSQRTDLIERAKAILAEAYEEAAHIIALYVQRNPKEQLQSLCKEIDPENWDALRKRVQRAQKSLQANESGTSGRTGPEKTESEKRNERHARQIARSAPEVGFEDPEAREAIVRHIAETDPRNRRRKPGRRVRRARPAARRLHG